MKKIDFINELYAYLSPLPQKERKEILDDFREHFREGEAAGKSEEQICFELGTPIECARQYVGDAVLRNQTKKHPHRKFLWSGALIINIVIALITLPSTLIFFLIGGLMCVFFAFTVPAFGSAAFLVFAISSTLAVLLLGVISLLLTAEEFREIVKKINS